MYVIVFRRDNDLEKTFLRQVVTILVVAKYMHYQIICGDERIAVWAFNVTPRMVKCQQSIEDILQVESVPLAQDVVNLGSSDPETRFFICSGTCAEVGT